MLTTTMPTWADGELCKALSKELDGNSGHACRAGCGGPLHGVCGEVEDPEGNEMNRICLRCVGKRKKGKEKSSNLSKRKTCRRFFVTNACTDERQSSIFTLFVSGSSTGDPLTKIVGEYLLLLCV